MEREHIHDYALYERAALKARMFIFRMEREFADEFGDGIWDDAIFEALGDVFSACVMDCIEALDGNPTCVEKAAPSAAG